MGKSLRFRGFTLIELLIVVAIIAILAAIAVPNFLEAQTRAKVARVKADQRSLATAIEAYTIDWNRASPGIAEGGASSPRFFGVPPDSFGGTNEQINRLWACLTTPVSYISSIPEDPFIGPAGMKGGIQEASAPNFNRKGYEYQTYPKEGKGFGTPTATLPTWLLVTQGNATFFIKAAATGITWHLSSFGPTRSGVNIGRCGGFNPEALAGFQPQFPNTFYDPTNGTVSFGNIVRSNKGVAPEGIGKQGTGVIGSMNTAC